MAERIIDHTWYEFLPVLGWITEDAAEAGRTLDQAARDLEAAAQEARRIAATIASDAAVRRLLRDEVHSVHDLARDRVAALRSEDPVPVASPVPVAQPLRPNRGLLFNVGRGLELLLTSEPSEQAMRSFSLCDPRWMDHHVWYPDWLADVRMEVTHALRGLSRAQSELELLYSDVATLLVVSSSSGRAVTDAQACADAAGHAHRGAANMGALVDVLQGLRDDILVEPPTGRVSYFFGSVPTTTTTTVDAVQEQ
ncbi:hypothetical protein ZWY2020_034425 [Hordeum vulgare]|nr:hypothetical protein ZWY2020_034425 [Hordeum vulgare]